MAGCRLVHRIALFAALAAQLREWTEVYTGSASEANWARYFDAETALAYHPAGSCRTDCDARAAADVTGDKAAVLILANAA